MEVLEDQHGHPLGRERLAEPAPSRERLLLRGGLSGRPHEWREPCLEPGALGIVLRDPLVELRGSLCRRVRFEDAAFGLHDLAERPERDPVAIGKTAALTPPRQSRLSVGVGKQLGTETALAHAGLADDRHELARALLRRALECSDQQCPLELAPDERRRGRAGHIRPEAGLRTQRAPERERLRLALDPDRLQRLPVEDALGCPVGRLGDSDGVHRSNSLQPRCGVHHVAGHQPFAELGSGVEGYHGFAGVYPDPHLKRKRGIAGVQLLNRLQHSEACPHGPLGVVLVRDWRAEHRHHGIADELLDRAAEPLDLLAQPPVIRPDPRPHILRISSFRRGGEAHQVAEQDRDDLPLLCRRRLCLTQRRGTERTERKLARQLPAA